MLQEVAAIVQARPPRGRLDPLQSVTHSGDNQSQTSNVSGNWLTLCLFVFAARATCASEPSIRRLDAAGTPVQLTAGGVTPYFTTITGHCELGLLLAIVTFS